VTATWVCAGWGVDRSPSTAPPASPAVPSLVDAAAAMVLPTAATSGEQVK
jgi:hypothetical protein